MDDSLQSLAGIYVAAGQDRFSEYRGLGVSAIQFKVVSQDENSVLILENTFRTKGGPARHLHYDQDEWFYAVEGEFVIEVGQARTLLKPGDSIFAPRKVPHVWACRRGSGAHFDYFSAGRQDGSLLSRSDQSQCNAPSKPRIMAITWDGIGWTAFTVGIETALSDMCQNMTL